MADRSGNDRRRRSGLPLAWLVLLILVPLAGPAPSAAGPYREYEIRFIGEASPLGKSPSDADLINAVAWMMSNKLDLPFPVGTKAYIYVNQATFVPPESARRPSHVWPGVPRGGLAHRALWERQAPRVPRTVRASGRASRTLADGVL